MSSRAKDFVERPGQERARVVGRSRHALHLQLPSGKVRMFVTQAPLHYQDGDKWLPIDTDLVDRGDRWAAPGCPVWLENGGKAHLGETGYGQQTSKAGLFTENTRNFIPSINIPPGQHKGDQLEATGNGWVHSLRVTENGLCETLTLTKKPAVLTGGDWFMLETRVDGLNLTEGWLDESIVAHGAHFPTPKAHDANGRGAPARRFVKKTGAITHIYTGVPVSWLEKAAYPVEIDPDFAADVADGYVQGQHAAYVTAHSTATAWGGANTTDPMGQSFGAGVYSASRLALKFDITTLPPTATVSRAYMEMVCIWNLAAMPFYPQFRDADWSPYEPIAAGSMQQIYDCILGAPFDAIWQHTVGLAQNTVYPSDDLNTDWVEAHAGSMIYYGMMSDRDGYPLTPAGDELLVMAMADHGTAAYRPVLVIEYALASTPIPGAGASAYTPVQGEFGALGLSLILYSPSIAVTLGSPNTVAYVTRGVELANLTERVEGYQHVVGAFGGYISATFSLSATLQEIEFWLAYGLNAHVEIKDQGNDWAWVGFVDSLDVKLGGLALQRGPVTAIANRVRLAYTRMESASSVNQGEQRFTAIAEDSNSQRKYGVLTKTLTAPSGGLTDAEAVQVRDLYLAESKNPKDTKSINFGGEEGAVNVTFNCVGYYARLNTPYHVTTTGYQDISAKLKAVLAADPNGLFPAGNNLITTNTTQVKTEETDEPDALSIIRSLVGLGDAAGARYLFLVSENNRVTYAPAPTTVDYMGVGYGQIKLRSFSGAPLQPWAVRPGRWAFLTTLLAGYSPKQDLRDDLRALFIEQATYTAPYLIQLQGGAVNTLPQVLAQYGLGEAS